ITESLVEFSHLYSLLRHLKVYLRRSFVVMSIVLFGSGISLYYGAFYTTLHPLIRACAALIFVILVIAINYLALLSGKVDLEAKKLSEVYSWNHFHHLLHVFFHCHR